MGKKTAVAGAGAAGIMAAISAASCGCPVTLFEHTGQAGKKLLLTGNGKCNFTNRDMDASHYHSGTSAGHIEKILERFSSAGTLAFFSDLGLLTKEKNGCIYPYTDMSSTVLSILKHEMERLDIRLVYDHHIQWSDDLFLINGERYDRVILAMGGKSFPKTGSDGSGFELLLRMGCSVEKVLPALTPVMTKEDVSQLKGIRCRARLKLFVNGVCVQRSEGELQPYEEGLSGICAMDISGLCIRALSREDDTYILCDFLPDMDEEHLRAYLLRMKEEFPERGDGGLLDGLFAPKLSRFLLHPLDSRRESFIDDAVDTIKHHRFRPDKKMCTDLSRAQTVSGGLSFLEVDENLMLKKYPGIYACGELLDVYGDCGGYNLQWAFSSGYAAGKLL